MDADDKAEVEAVLAAAAANGHPQNVKLVNGQTKGGKWWVGYVMPGGESAVLWCDDEATAQRILSVMEVKFHVTKALKAGDAKARS